MSLDLSRETTAASIALETGTVDARDRAPSSGDGTRLDAARLSREIRHNASWVHWCREFLACHRRPLNVALHCVTTPLSILGLFSLLNLMWPMAWAVAAALYGVLIARMIPIKTLLVTMLVMSGLGIASSFLSVGPVMGVSMFLIGYVAQEIAHKLTGEATLQSTYTIGSPMHRAGDFLRHTVLLLPLILVIAGRRKQSPLRLLVTRNAVIPIKLTGDDQLGDLKAIRDWVQVAHPSLGRSTHWWQHDLDGEARSAFDRLCNDHDIRSMIRRHHGTGYDVRPVYGMNELYVTGPPKSTSSDTVFYMPHVDGPWSVFPGARLYRCMLAASANAEVTTHFPMVGKKYREPEGHRLETGSAVAFDFNRELHYITRVAVASQTEPRVNLKLHFIAFPRALPGYGGLLERLTTCYDVKARDLFLQTIQPTGIWANVKTLWVLGWTKVFELIARFAGWTNLAYVVSIALIALSVGDWRWFAVGTSFVHYMIYAGTLRERQRLAFGEFKRNAIFYKSISMATLFAVYVASGIDSIVSVVVVSAGFALAFAAGRALGLNRTYFSAELGFDRPQQVDAWPYGRLPHPMITGSMVGISGMLLSTGFRAEAAWLAIGHLAAYAAILTQEIQNRRSGQSPRSGKSPVPQGTGTATENTLNYTPQSTRGTIG